jgi:hypothetical protein
MAGLVTGRRNAGVGAVSGSSTADGCAQPSAVDGLQGGFIRHRFVVVDAAVDRSRKIADRPQPCKPGHRSMEGPTMSAR